MRRFMVEVTYVQDGRTYTKTFYSEKELDNFADSGVKIISIISQK